METMEKIVLFFFVFWIALLFSDNKVLLHERLIPEKYDKTNYYRGYGDVDFSWRGDSLYCRYSNGLRSVDRLYHLSHINTLYARDSCKFILKE